MRIRFLDAISRLLLLAGGVLLGGCSSAPPPPANPPAKDGNPASLPKIDAAWSLDSLTDGKSFVGHKSAIHGVALSAQGHRAVSWGSDKTLRLWDVPGGKELHRLDVPEGIGKAAMAPDGKHILYGGRTRTTKDSTTYDFYQLRLIDAETGKEVRRFPDVPDMVDSVVFSPDSSRALSGGTTRTYLWDVGAGKLLHTFDGMHNHSYAVAISPDGRRGLTVSGQNVVVLDLEKKTTLGTFTGSTEMPMSLAFSRDGRHALSGGFDRKLRHWDIATQKEDRKVLDHAGHLTRVGFLHDPRYALSATTDGVIHLWDIDAGKEVASLPGLLAPGPAGPLAVSDNGRWLLHATADFAVVLRKVPALP